MSFGDLFVVRTQKVELWTEAIREGNLRAVE
jgi:hypothetical protein